MDESREKITPTAILDDILRRMTEESSYDAVITSVA